MNHVKRPKRGFYDGPLSSLAPSAAKEIPNDAFRPKYRFFKELTRPAPHQRRLTASSEMGQIQRSASIFSGTVLIAGIHANFKEDSPWAIVRTRPANQGISSRNPPGQKTRQKNQVVSQTSSIRIIERRQMTSRR
jgi:hypothetical protein